MEHLPPRGKSVIDAILPFVATIIINVSYSEYIAAYILKFDLNFQVGS